MTTLALFFSGFPEYGYITLKLVCAFVTVLIFLKIFGIKQQLKQMTSLDLLFNFVLGAILSGFILSDFISIVDFFVVMFIFIILVFIVNFIVRNTDWGRDLFIGATKIIIRNGVIDENMVEKLQLSVHDIAEAMRAENIHLLSDVKQAQIEPGGFLTIVKRGEHTFPKILIDNGVVDMVALAQIGRTKQWLFKELSNKNIKNIDNIFYATWRNGKLIIIKKK